MFTNTRVCLSVVILVVMKWILVHVLTYLTLNLTGVRGKKLKKLINIPSFSNTNPNDA